MLPVFTSYQDACDAANELNNKKKNNKGQWFPKRIREVITIQWIKTAKEK